MKRKIIKPIEVIGRTFTIFIWRKCCLCGDGFRRERGWWALIYRRWLYLCKDCGGGNRESAIKGFLEWEKRRKENRPDPPMPMGLTEGKTKSQQKTLTGKSRPKTPPPKPKPAGIRIIEEGERYPK